MSLPNSLLRRVLAIVIPYFREHSSFPKHFVYGIQSNCQSIIRKNNKNKE